MPLGLGRTLQIFPGDVIQRAILAERQVDRVCAILLVSASFETLTGMPSGPSNCAIGVPPLARLSISPLSQLLPESPVCTTEKG